MRNAATWRAEVWRLWTAHLTHFSLQHAVTNALVCVIAGHVVENKIGARSLCAALLLIAPLISIGLLFWSPQLVQYRGLSGITMALTVAAIICLAQKYPSLRVGVALLAVIILAKLLVEVITSTTTPQPLISVGFAGLPSGVSVEWRVHVLGVFAGLWLGSLRASAAIRGTQATVENVMDCRTGNISSDNCGKIASH